MRTPKLHVAKDGTNTWQVKFRAAPGRAAKTTSETFTDETKALKFCQLLDALGPAGALRSCTTTRNGSTYRPWTSWPQTTSSTSPASRTAHG